MGMYMNMSMHIYMYVYMYIYLYSVWYVRLSSDQSFNPKSCE